MKNNHLAKLCAMGVVCSTITVSAEVLGTIQSALVFGTQPQEVSLSKCEADVVSIGNIHSMIEQRNRRDKKQVRSSTDKMTHL